MGRCEQEEVDGPAVLGVSAYYHDSAAALVQDGTILAAAQEERFTRVKNDPRFPVAAVGACLRETGIPLADVELLVYYEKPFMKLDRILKTLQRVGPSGWSMSRRALPVWAAHRIDIPRHIRRSLGTEFRGTVTFAEHHKSHAASAFYPSPFENAAILTLDAVGEWATSSIGVGRGSQIDILQETRFPHSLGMLYSAFTAYGGFRVNSGEYKLMGLAPYGEPRYSDVILEEVVDVHEDGSLHLDLRYFAFEHGAHMTSEALNTLLGGPPREPEGPLDQRYLDIAASIQRVCELAVIRSAQHARDVTGERQLVMAGGVALNCVANGRLLEEGIFDDVWIQPAAGDAGAALGAALLGWYEVSGEERKPQLPDGQQGSLLGPSFSEDDVSLYLDGAGATYRRLVDESTLLDQVCDWLEVGKVVGWFQGRMEFGPRALGSRSVLADPRRPEIQSAVNTKIKFRESFRPFAPSVLREHAHEVFEVEPGQEFPYMMTTTKVRLERRRTPTAAEQIKAAFADPLARLSVPRSDVPAVTHVDYSARLQTVDPERHGRFYRLLERFHQRTGCPALLNTSFNVRGEPVVHSPHDAYLCFMATNMDCLVLEDSVLVKEEQPPVAGLDVERRHSTYPPD